MNFTTAVDIAKPNQIAELRKFIGQENMTQPLMISIFAIINSVLISLIYSLLLLARNVKCNGKNAREKV